MSRTKPEPPSATVARKNHKRVEARLVALADAITDELADAGLGNSADEHAEDFKAVEAALREVRTRFSPPRHSEKKK